MALLTSLIRNDLGLEARDRNVTRGLLMAELVRVRRPLLLARLSRPFVRPVALWCFVWLAVRRLFRVFLVFLRWGTHQSGSQQT